MLAEYKRYCHVNRNGLPFPLYGGSMFLMLPVNPALCFIPWQLSLRQVVPDVIQPLALRTSSPSLPRHLYHHHSLAHTFFFSSQYMTIPLPTTFMHFLYISPTFAIPLILSFRILSSMVTPLIHHPHFRHLLWILHWPCTLVFVRVLAPSYISCTIIT